MVTRRELLQEGRVALGGGEARLDAEVLLRHLLGEGRGEFYRDLDEAVPAFLPDRFRRLLAERVAGAPLQYLLGQREFYGLQLAVNGAVLIPRPETEVLVETALEIMGDLGTVLAADLGTGSGAIAIAVAVALPQARVLAVDISAAALGVAWANAGYHGVLKQLRFFCGDLTGPLAVAGYRGRLDIILSNPPYIPQGDLALLQREVRDYEPRLALDGGVDGLYYYRRLAREAAAFLRPGGFLVVEVGAGQAPTVEALLAGEGVYRLEPAVPDLAGIPRVVVARKRAGAGP